MSHTINYGIFEDGPEKEAMAMKDVMFWLGDQFDRIHAACVTEYKTKSFGLETFRFNAAFAGIQGYPVTAWYNLIVKECAE